MRLAAIPDMGEGIPPEMGRSIEDNTIEPEWVTDHVFVDIKGDFYYATLREQCQLERQDQLQEMWIKSFPGELIVERFYRWFSVQPVSPEFTSMEQLWLSFVLAERFNKKWDGADWVNG